MLFEFRPRDRKTNRLFARSCSAVAVRSSESRIVELVRCWFDVARYKRPGGVVRGTFVDSVWCIDECGDRRRGASPTTQRIRRKKRQGCLETSCYRYPRGIEPLRERYPEPNWLSREQWKEPNPWC